MNLERGAPSESTESEETEDRAAESWHDKFFRWRGWLVIVLGVALLGAVVAIQGFRRPSLRDALLAAPVIALGIAMRVWARSYLLRGTNTRRVHARRLVVDGPYRRLRNPLYVGNMAIAAGLALAFAGPIAGAALLLLMFALYSVVVRSEETILRTTFPERYDEVASAVPRWWPRLRPFTAAECDDLPNLFGALRSEAQRIAGASGAWGVAFWLACVTL
jgi:protein-S-isoprenylcysteine O-methyltransferase Ste14